IHDRHFTPERAKRFVRETLPQLVASRASPDKITEAVIREIHEPTASMEKSFKALDPAHQQLLIAMLDAGSGTVTFKGLGDSLDRLSAGKANLDQLTEDMSSHFLRIEDEE